MRYLLTTLLLTAFMALNAQRPDSAAPRFIQYPVKGYVVLKNGNKINLRGLTYADSNQVVLYTPGSNMLNGGYTYKDDIRTMQPYTVAVADIELLKAQRQSFIKGAGIGALIGFGAGALLGFVTYQDDFYRTGEENDTRRSNRSLVGGIAGAIPTGLIGGFAGGLFVKKRFPIHGRKEQLRKTMDRLYH